MRGIHTRQAASTRRRFFLFGLLACMVVPATAQAQEVRRFDLALKQRLEAFLFSIEGE